MQMNLRKSFVTAALALGTAGSALASSATGTLTVAHLNGSVTTGRGVCIQLSPALPGTGWACLYTNNMLYKEITATLLAARIAGQICTISWSILDIDTHKVIDTAEC
jgi:hypothetical protein